MTFEHADVQGLREAIAREPVPWDDTRKARVRARVLAGRPRPVRAARSFGWPALAGVAALAMIAGVVVDRATLRPAAPAPVAIAAPPRTLPLPAGARAELGVRADVVLASATPRRVQVVHRAGRARYDVTAVRDRAFDVRVGAVELHVAGTVFSVDVDGPRVSVEVEHGVVHVRDGRSEHAVVPGQRLTVPLARAPEPELPPVAAEPAPPSEPVVVAAAAPLARRAAPDRDADLDRTLARVDGLRRSGELSEAADLLDRAAQAHRDDPRLPTALFTLGRVQRARGLHGDAARAFRRCWQLAPAGPLAPDAHAQEARAWAAAQDREAAEQAARAYLRLAPRGPHADAMKRLLE